MMAVPAVISVKGKVASASGLLNGQGYFKFALVDQAGTTIIWRNDGTTNLPIPPGDDGEAPDQTAVEAQIDKGLFSINLGDESIQNMSSLDASNFSQDYIYLRIWFSETGGPFVRLNPDQRLVATAFAVMAASVDDGAITEKKLATGAVTFDKLQDGAVGASKLSNNAVLTHSLGDDTITSVKLKDGSITADKVVDGAISNSKLADDAVGVDELQDLAVTAAKLVDLSVTTSKLANESVTDGKIAQGAITTLKIAPEAVTSTKIADESIRSNHMDQDFLATLGGGGGSGLPGGAMVVSKKANDEDLISQGFVQTGTIPGLPERWRNMTSNGYTAHNGEDSHIAWTGREAVLFGGIGEQLSLKPHVYTAGNDYSDSPFAAWKETDTTNIPSVRRQGTAIWTGQEVIIWGGADGNIPADYNDGARYYPETDTWLTLTNVPNGFVGRSRHTAVWTGTEMIVWGGYGDVEGSLRTGAAYDPSTFGTWTLLTEHNAPTVRDDHTAVWTGTSMIVFGGLGGLTERGDGGIFTPSKPTNQQWEPLPMGGTPPGARYKHHAIWTGKVMIVWGGLDEFGEPLNTGSMYDPQTQTWTEMTTFFAPEPRRDGAAVWTGDSMIVFGGATRDPEDPNDWNLLHDGAIFNPESNTWTRKFKDPSSVLELEFPTMAWTGSELIIWSGVDIVDYGRAYRPASPQLFLYTKQGGS